MPKNKKQIRVSLEEYPEEISNLMQFFADGETLYSDCQIEEIKSHVKQAVLSTCPKMDSDLIEGVIDQMVKPLYQIDTDNHNVYQAELERAQEECDYIDKLKEIEIPEEYQKVDKQFKYLSNLEQPEQKSDEWFDKRHEMISASDAATSLDENHHSKDFILLEAKTHKRPPFNADNDYVHHGKKYEEIATKIYELAYNIRIKEFGLIQHPTISHIGASPDGIGSKWTIDYQFSGDYYGRMLEIKCPYKRVINKQGQIKQDIHPNWKTPTENGICPHYYWVQVQNQLECCDLEKCDFWQCKLIEYESYEDYLADYDHKAVITEEQNLIKDYGDAHLSRGCIIELVDSQKLEDPYATKYVYPMDINMTTQQYQKWLAEKMHELPEILAKINAWEKEYADKNEVEAKKYVFRTVKYWKLVMAHNVIIHRDRKWYMEAKHRFKKFWDRVLFYRNPKNKKDLKKLRKEVEEYKKKEEEKWARIMAAKARREAAQAERQIHLMQSDSSDSDAGSFLDSDSDVSNDGFIDSDEEDDSDSSEEEVPKVKQEKKQKKKKQKASSESDSSGGDDFIDSDEDSSEDSDSSEDDVPKSNKKKPAPLNDGFISSSDEESDTDTDSEKENVRSASADLEVFNSESCTDSDKSSVKSKSKTSRKGKKKEKEKKSKPKDKKKSNTKKKTSAKKKSISQTATATTNGDQKDHIFNRKRGTINLDLDNIGSDTDSD